MRALLVLCALATLAGCETRTRGILVPAVPDTVAVQDTVPSKPPRGRPPWAAREPAPGLVASSVCASGEFVVVRYRGAHGDAALGVLPITGDVGLEQSTGIQGPLWHLQYDATYATSEGPPCAVGGHAYLYPPSGYERGWVMLAPGDTLWLVGDGGADSDVCAGLRLSGCDPPGDGNYGEVLGVLLPAPGGRYEAIDVGRASASGKAGKYRWWASQAVPGGRVALAVEWGRARLELGAVRAVTCP